MPLSCSCDWDYEFEEGDWYYWGNEPDFEPLASKRRKRCISCGELINTGSPSLSHKRVRYPYNDIESRIRYGMSVEDALCEEATIECAPHYHCERCGEIFLNLLYLGFECLSPSENMPDMLKEYQSTYDPPKLEKV